MKTMMLMGALLAGLTTALPSQALELHVDAAAAAGGDGSAARPFATATAARDAVRAARAAGKIVPRESVVITFAPGDYVHLNAFWLEKQDSGSCAYAPLVLRAEKPRTVRFLGGIGLKQADFAPVTDGEVLKKLPEEARSKAFVADVSRHITSAVAEPPHEFTGALPGPLVFMRGTIAEPARWPNAGEYVQFYKKDKVDDLAFAFDDPRTKRWDFKRGVWLCGYWTHDWFQNTVHVDRFGPEETKDKDGKTVVRENVVRFDKMRSYGVMKGTYGGHKGRRFYAMNLLEELDAPGEWYLDRTAKKLYVIPPDGVRPQDADDIILAVNRTTVITAQPGTHDVRLENLDFTGSAASLATLPLVDSAIENCRFSCCGGGALSIGGPARRVRVSGCEVTMVGATGISVGAGDMTTLTRGDVVVENCHIHKFGQLNRTYAGAVGFGGVGNTLRKCELHDAPHLAIASGGTFNLFEYNNVHHVLLETADAGAYYSGRDWKRQGCVLRYNYFHDLGRIDGSCVAIYYDDCGSGEAAYGNIIHKAGLAFLVGGGRDHPIRNNIISSCLSGISLNSRGMAWATFNADPSHNTKKGDRSHLLRERALTVGYESGAWLDAFPRLANVMNDNWAMPFYDPVENNIFIDVKKSLIGVSGGDHFDAARMAPIAGNLVVSTVGAKNVTTNVPASVAKGFKILVGTEANPIDPGVDSLAAGDFQFLPESVLLKECPGFDVIPFREIPNASYERDLRDYASLVKVVDGAKVWTAALQKALDENERVRIPASSETYWIDAPVVVPSGRRINAHGATISLLKGCNTLMLRNASAVDGQLKPVPADAKRDCDIAITGGTWCDWREGRAGYGKSGMFNLEKRQLGNFYGVSTLFYFGTVDRLSLTSVKFVRCAAFAVQCGDAKDVTFRHIRFERCYADGLHLNGNLERVRAYDVKGCVGDDLVALNAYDWLNSSVNFGPQRDMVFEDLELIPPKKGGSYPAIRILPAVYRYADGTEVDCAISDVVFRKVRGIRNFKMYAQTPPCKIGKKREWYKVGSGGNIRFEDVVVDFNSPIDCWAGSDYVNQDPVRGHIAPFEFGANLSKVTFKDVTVNFHCDKWRLSHLALVGPKSCRWFAKKPGEADTEVFDPDLSCEVGEVVLDNVKIRGIAPAELVRATSFDNVNGDGESTGKGVIRKLTVIPPKPAEAACPRHVLNNRRKEASAGELKQAKAWTSGGRQKAADALGIRPYAPAEGAKADVAVALPASADAAHPAPVVLFALSDEPSVCLPTNTLTGRGYACVTFASKDYSRALDALAARPELNLKRVAVVGHGADGLAALKAGAADPRIALVVVNDAGVAGQADLLKLMAPRPVYVASAFDDAASKPEEEHKAVVSAASLWRGLGVPSLALTCGWTSVYPGMTDHSGRVGYHLRNGGRGLMPADWDLMLDFLDLRL